MEGNEMVEPPKLKNWKAVVEEHMNKSSYNEEDLVKVIHMCEEFRREIQPISQWIGRQAGFVNKMNSIFHDMYVTRFDKEPPTPPTEGPVTEVILDTPERRKQAIREVALAMSQPGDTVSDEAVLEEMSRRGMKICAANPNAAISTVLYGFRPQFAKVESKRGVFRRQE
jgi:hypothetical protein